MNKQEQKARKICALCNWSNECEDCPHREWLTGEWHYMPRWDWKECTEWNYYLENPIVNKWRKFLCWVGLHKWYLKTYLKPPFVHRICIRCGVEEEYIVRDNDYRNVYWRHISDKMM